MKRILAAVLFAICAPALAQTYPPLPVTGYINEQGNLFAMTHSPDGHSPFHIQMQTVVNDLSPDVLEVIGVGATGQNGYCGRARCSTLFPWLVDSSEVQHAAVWMMTAMPAFNADGTPILVPDLRYAANCAASPPTGCTQLYTDVAPAVDGGGNPIIFTPMFNAAGEIVEWQLLNKSPVDSNGVPLYPALPAGHYNLHEVGTSAPAGLSTIETRTSTSYYVPPPPPCTDCGGE